MHKRTWRVIQGVAGALILFFIVRSILANWHNVGDHPVQWQIRWGYVVASLLATWCMYAVLIAGWRAVVQGWRQRLGMADAARIWTVSSLAKYIPGMVWSITGMAVMAQRRGVSGAAAAGSAIVMQLVSIATGTALALLLTGTVLLDRIPGGSVGAVVLAAVTLIAIAALTSPRLTRRVGVLIGRPDALQPVDLASLTVAGTSTLVAWAGYGLALQLLALGVLRDASLSWTTATGAFAAAYVVGFVTPFLPGGIGLREGILVLLLRDAIGVGPAIGLAAVSRLVLTVNELGAAMPFLLYRRQRDFSSSK